MDVLFNDLPKYAATDKIKEGLILYMLREQCRPGDAFLSDREVMRLTGRGRTSIRSSLKLLQDEGWIERRGGVGTFVGGRIAQLRGKRSFLMTNDESKNNLVHVGVMMGGLLKDEGLASNESLGRDWYFGAILDGINTKALEKGFITQLMNCVNTDPRIVLRHFEKYPPDILLCVGTPISFLAVFVKAQALGIPVALISVKFSQFDLFNIYEDNDVGATLAVDYLADRGHNRIGFLQILTQSGDWSVDRYHGYRKAIKRRGLDSGSELVQWVSPNLPENVETVRDYLRKVKPTALICGCYHAANLLKDLVTSGELSVPDDLSVIVFDQCPDLADVFGGIKPTTVALPLFAMGKKVGDMVHTLLNKPYSLPKQIVIPCTLIEGGSVRKLL